MLYTAGSAARWTVEGVERPDEGRRPHALSLGLSGAVLAANLILMLLPPAIGILLLVGLAR